MDKKSFRKQALQRLGQFNESAACSPLRGNVNELWGKVEEMPQFASAHTLLLYWSMPSEVPTWDFADRWLATKRIVLPLVVGDSLVLKEYSGRDSLVSGYKGILEPRADAVDVTPEEVDFAIIPGVAFDRACHRMGRGKGFYDRLLPDLPAFKLGVAFDCQLYDEIPVDSWDFPLDAIVTPSACYYKD